MKKVPTASGNYLVNKNTRYLSLPPTSKDMTQGQWPEGQLKWRFSGRDVENELMLELC